MNINEQTDPKLRVAAIGDFRFRTEYIADPKDPGQMKAIEWVSWRKIGDGNAPRTEEAISRLRPNREKRRQAAFEWQFIEKYYEAWKADEEIPLDGTPLAAWPGCDQALAEVLKMRGVLTLEQFAALPDAFLSGIPIPDIRRRVQLAGAFLAAQQGDSKVAAELASRDERIEKLERVIAEMKAAPPADAKPVDPSERPTRQRERANA